MSNLIPIDCGYVPPGRQEDVVTLLREMLAKAEAGEFNGICLLTISAREGGGYDAIGEAWAGSVTTNVHAVLGGLRVLEARFIREEVRF
jgi:hypothetical protein